MTDIRHVDWHFNEFLVETATLDPVDAGIYAIACAMICRRGGPIERADLKRFVKCHGRVFENALARLVAAGALTLNGTEICAKWCVKELENARKRIVKWSENGAKGGRPSNKPNGLAEPGGFHACMTRAELPITITEDTSVPSGTEGAGAPPPPAGLVPSEEGEQPLAPLEPVDLVKQIFDRGKQQLGQKSGSLLGKMRAAYGDLAVIDAIDACEAEAPSNPPAFFVKCLQARRADAAGRGRRSPHMEMLEAFDAVSRY
jgi:hypothetical protein